MDKLDFKKTCKDLYLPATSPSIVLVPEMTFIMVDGKGDPNIPDGDFTKAVELLYALAYTIKMNKMAKAMDGYVDFVVPPLEGLWWYENGGALPYNGKGSFCWTAMIRQPEFVTQEVFSWAKSEALKKKPGLPVENARLSVFNEGLCVQCMHLGSFDSEPETVKKMDEVAVGRGLAKDLSDTRRHHEIYLNDPRKTDPAKLKTVVRHPVK